MKANQVSVVLACYNGEKTLEKTLQSINNQKYNLELIFIDDGSNDSSLEIFKKHKFSENCQTRLITRENKGFLYSLDEGIKLSSGDFIARIDSDDIWLENHLLLIMDEFDRDDNLVLVGAQGIEIDEKNITHGELNVPVDVTQIIKYLHKDSPFIHSSVVFKKEAYNKTSGYLIGDSVSAMHISDYNLWFELSKIGRLINIKERTVLYRVSANSMSRTINRIVNYTARYSVMKKVNSYYKKYFFYSLIERIKVKLRIYQYKFLK